MISITELWCGIESRNHNLRYNKPFNLDNVRPVVVWNSTKRCNLRCLHCYSSSNNSPAVNELATNEAKCMIDDLASFGSPCLLFSGGEPFLREDLFELLDHAKKRALPAAVSSNGTLIDTKTAKKLKETDVRYVGISLDGIGEVHDRFRGVPGTSGKVTEAFQNLREFGVKSGIRFTLTKNNLKELPKLFEYVKEYEIERVCFYHVVPVGRASSNLVPDNAEIRDSMDRIIKWAETRGRKQEAGSRVIPEILTVDNHADGIYLYLKSMKYAAGGRNPTSYLPPLTSEQILKLIKQNGGAKKSSGAGIACIDWEGNVHPDQFWRNLVLGNIREREFSALWMDNNIEILSKLRERTRHITGRCSKCRFLDLCGGGLRSRANAAFGDPWRADPGCYLTDIEIGL